MRILAELIDAVKPYYLIYFLVKFFILLTAWLFVKKYRPYWRNFAYFVLIILSLRMVFFDQIYSWTLYKKYLLASDIGFRQKDVLNYELDKFYIKPKKTKFLAVGSSQTGAIYRPHLNLHGYPMVFSLSGCGPMDLLLYRKHISSFEPESILLYLSEFDLAIEPSLDSAKIGPNQGFYLLKIYAQLKDMSKYFKSEIGLKEMIIGEFFPEYKYSFIFKGLVNKLMRKNKALEIKKFSEIGAEQVLKQHLKNPDKKLSEKAIYYNVPLLKDFLSFCKKKSIKVIIIEGQYNPLAYTKKSLALNKIVHDKLVTLDTEFENVTFIPRSAIREFKIEDYSDGYHLKPEVAYNFAKKILSFIEKNN